MNTGMMNMDVNRPQQRAGTQTWYMSGPPGPPGSHTKVEAPKVVPRRPPRCQSLPPRGRIQLEDNVSRTAKPVPPFTNQGLSQKKAVLVNLCDSSLPRNKASTNDRGRNTSRQAMTPFQGDVNQHQEFAQDNTPLGHLNRGLHKYSSHGDLRSQSLDHQQVLVNAFDRSLSKEDLTERFVTPPLDHVMTSNRSSQNDMMEQKPISSVDPSYQYGPPVTVNEHMSANLDPQQQPIQESHPGLLRWNQPMNSHDTNQGRGQGYVQDDCNNSLISDDWVLNRHGSINKDHNAYSGRGNQSNEQRIMQNNSYSQEQTVNNLDLNPTVEPWCADDSSTNWERASANSYGSLKGPSISATFDPTLLAPEQKPMTTCHYSMAKEEPPMSSRAHSTPLPRRPIMSDSSLIGSGGPISNRDTNQDRNQWIINNRRDSSIPQEQPPREKGNVLPHQQEAASHANTVKEVQPGAKPGRRFDAGEYNRAGMQKLKDTIASQRELVAYNQGHSTQNPNRRKTRETNLQVVPPTDAKSLTIMREEGPKRNLCLEYLRKAWRPEDRNRSMNATTLDFPAHLPRDMNVPGVPLGKFPPADSQPPSDKANESGQYDVQWTWKRSDDSSVKETEATHSTVALTQDVWRNDHNRPRPPMGIKFLSVGRLELEESFGHKCQEERWIARAVTPGASSFFRAVADQLKQLRFPSAHDHRSLREELCRFIAQAGLIRNHDGSSCPRYKLCIVDGHTMAPRRYIKYLSQYENKVPLSAHQLLSHMLGLQVQVYQVCHEEVAVTGCVQKEGAEPIRIAEYTCNQYLSLRKAPGYSQWICDCLETKCMDVTQCVMCGEWRCHCGFIMSGDRTDCYRRACRRWRCPQCNTMMHYDVSECQGCGSQRTEGSCLTCCELNPENDSTCQEIPCLKTPRVRKNASNVRIRLREQTAEYCADFNDAFISPSVLM